MKRFAIIGTGAVGGYYGALLQKAGQEVHFLLHRDYEFVKANGLFVESVHGDFRLPQVKAYEDPQRMPRCDGVIVALKTTARAALREILPQVVAEDGVVLTLQNGLGVEEEIAALCGPQRVVGGLCFLCANKIGPGRVRHLDYGLITLGEYRADGQPGGITPRLEKLGAVLRSAGVPIELIDDLPQARWKKLVWNIPFNGLSVTENCLTDELMRRPQTRALCRRLMEETAVAAAACARPIAPIFIEKMLVDTAGMAPYAPSMKLDFERGHPMEIDAIYGRPLCAARAVGVAMPETEQLYRRLLELDQRNNQTGTL
jgi:2-dehydropantoate 2-reductase